MYLDSQRIPAIKYRVWAEIDLDHATHNFNQIKACTTAKLCCVIKANAYGHGAVKLAQLYTSLGADYLAVSNIEEALQLRQHEIRLPILILGYTAPECASLLAKQGISQCVYSYDYGMALSQAATDSGVTVKIHLKMDTGMGRIGFLCRLDGKNELDQALSVSKAPGLEPEGIFMHFAVSDEGEEGRAYTDRQFACFMEAISYLEQNGVRFAIRHCANSAAIFDYPAYHLDMVRAGVVLYGLHPSEKVQNLPTLNPVMSLHSLVAHIKTVEAGQSVSYGRTYIADRCKRIATVPIGYADGFRRLNGQGRYCLAVHGNPAPIVGRVCMDQLMLDVSDIDCAVGDEVIVFGAEQPFTVDTLAALNQTINYEIVCDVGERVPRAYISNGEIMDWMDALI